MHTIINDKIIKIVKVNNVNYDGRESNFEDIYLYVKNQQVYRMINDQLSLVFDFSLSQGDTLNLAIEPSEFYDSITPIIVDSTGFINVDGEDLKVIHLSYSLKYFGPNYEFEKSTYSISEKVGNISIFLNTPDLSFGDTFTNKSLRCYSDNIIHYTSDWWNRAYPGEDCDMLIDDAIEIEDNSTSFNYIFPNPVKDILNIKDWQQITKIEIYNLQGKLIDIFEVDTNQIDLSCLESGNYIIRFFKINRVDKLKILKL